MTNKIRNYPTRIPIDFDNRKGTIVLDQIHAIDKSRIIRKLGILDSKTVSKVLESLETRFTF